MGFKSSSLLSLALLLACSSAIYAFDITQLLGQSQEFTTFNKYLTETKLAEQINSRNTVTVLAVDNAGLASIAGKSPEVIKAITSTHVILDYFDEKKLMEAQGSGQQLTTLFQASGLAVNQQGFLKVALVGEGEIAFSSAQSSSQDDAALLVSTVTTEPYNISILQVTKPIIAPGVDSQTPASSGAQPSQDAKAPVSAQVAKAPVAAQSAKAPAQSAKAPLPSSQGAKAPAPAQTVPAQSAKAPTSSETAAVPSPFDESTVQSPKEAAEAPTSVAAAPGPLADGPVADGGDVADADAHHASSSSSIKMGLAGAVMTFASLLVAL